MKKAEKQFIGGVLILAAVLWAILFFMNRGSHSTIRITVDGEEYGVYSLAQDQTISIGSTNVCEIKDGQVKMIQADCPDGLCLRQRAIGPNGGVIVCLPNKVVIESGNGGEVLYEDSEESIAIDGIT